MTTTATAKPKAKFSSRNLSAVFKAPLRTKPLQDNTTGPLQRPNSRMVVLGRAAVAAPAPLNTPSLKRESQVHNTHVSLVPAGSNWAEQAEKPKENEAAEPETAPAEVALPTAPPEKAWTPESVAEHLHTGSAPVRSKATVETCGRWGDDAVEQDIVQNDIRRQRQKEREFPDLKEAVEETMHHDQGHGHASAAADRSPSMGPQLSEQHHGRATGRWAHFSEQEEMHRPMYEDRWSRDRFGRNRDDRWSHDQQDEGDRWLWDRYSRYDDGYGRERRPFYESSREDNAISPVPNDSRTHFSRSDARFDMVASGDRDRVLSHSPHRMDWGSGRLECRGGRSSSPAARFLSPQPNRSLTQSAAPASPSPAPTTADTAPARAMNWRNASSPDHGPDRAWGTPRRAANAWSKDDEPHTTVAEEAGSSTESSSHSSASTSPSPAQQVQLLKRPKMLFDPKTGGMVSAEDSPAAALTKRQATGRGGKEDRDREASSAPKASESVALQPGNVAQVSQASAVCSTGRVDTKDPLTTNAEDVNPSASVCPDDGSTIRSIAVNSVEVAAADASARQAVDDECVEATMKKTTKVVARRSTSGSKRAQAAADPRTSKPNPRHNREARSKKDSRADTGKVTDRSQRGVLAQGDRRPCKAAQTRAKASGREVREVSTQKMDQEEVAVLQQIAAGPSGGVVVISGEQGEIEVSDEVGGFETVKPRRVVLSEKQQSTQQAAAPAARASESEGMKHARASPADAQTKGEAVHENFGMVAKREVDAQRASKPRGSNPRKHRDNRAEQTNKGRKPRPASKHQPKQSLNGLKSKKTAQAASPGRSSVPPAARPAAKPSEQVAGEAPAESPASKKRSQYVKKSAQPETKRAQQRPKKEKQGGNSNEREAPSNAAAARKPELAARRQSQRAATTAEKAPAAAKARPKQVYVVKTPAPAASATSSAA